MEEARVVKGGKGIVVRRESEMTSEKVCELAAGTRVVVRRVVSVASTNGPVDRACIAWGESSGWCSLRLLGPDARAEAPAAASAPTAGSF